MRHVWLTRASGTFPNDVSFARTSPFYFQPFAPPA